MNNEGKYALWMPNGSIRAVLAITLTIAAVVAVFKPIAAEALAAIFGAAGTAWGLYFGTRAGESHPQE